MSEKITFGGEPKTPPPDNTQPWIWTSKGWLLIGNDTADGVPSSLDEKTEKPQPRK